MIYVLKYNKVSKNSGRNMERVSKYGQMALHTRDIGETIWLMGRGGSCMQMEISMKAFEKTIKLKAKVYIYIKMAHHMQVNDVKTNSMGLE